MTSKKRTQTAPTSKGPPNPQKRGDIGQYFADTPPASKPPHGPKMAPISPASHTLSLADSPAPSVDSEGSVKDILCTLPTREDLENMLQKLETSFTTRLESVGADIKHVGSRVQVLEEERELLEDRLLHLETGMMAHNIHLQRLHRTLDDQDNRGRRNNLRIRGLPEPHDTREILSDTLRAIFNALLRRSPEAPIHFDRAHRSLKPRGAPTAAPRDVICRFHYYRQKEDVLHAARNREVLDMEGNILQVYPDLSWTTLQARRILKPITDI
uniref:Uncharacterized protein n=1 Tax=Leptobrachium leishanense TaxID=445787 RepID=A0A8C5WHQ8_9ANUR